MEDLMNGVTIGGDLNDSIRLDVPLPEDISIENLPRINDMKQIWRSGIKQLEDDFAEHIAKMNDAFEKKALEFDRVREQLIRNHNFIKKFYLDTQKTLEK